MNGKVRIVDRYTRAMIRRNPTTLFIFGDNLQRVGYGGQAAEARGEPNVVGIITKMSPSAFLYDTQYLIVREPLITAFVRLVQHLKSGQDIVWPADGVGTGLARLPETGPMLFQFIELATEYLFKHASSVINEN